MSFDELLGLLFTLYIVGSIVSGLLRRGGATRGRGKVEQEREGGPVRDWEEELRELFGEPREPESSAQPGESWDDSLSPQPEEEFPPPLPDAEAPWWPQEVRPEGQDRQHPFPGEADSPWSTPWPAEPTESDGELDLWPAVPPPTEVEKAEEVSRTPESGPEPEKWTPGAGRVHRAIFRDRQQLRMAVLMREILDRPRALRPYSPPRPGRGVS